MNIGNVNRRTAVANDDDDDKKMKHIAFVVRDMLSWSTISDGIGGSNERPRINNIYY